MLLGQTQVQPESWYQSGTAWTIISVAVATIFGVLALWAAFRSNNPRRSLHIYLDSAVSLLRSAPGLGDEIAVQRHGQMLTKPYVATVHVVSRSSRDIPRAAFDGKPLELDFSVPVIALLEQQSDAGRKGIPKPTVAVTAHGLHVGPALLTSSHELSFTVLLDGKPRLEPLGELADVNVYDKPPRPRQSWRGRVTTLVVAMMAAAVIALIANNASDFPPILFMDECKPCQ